MQTYPSPLVLQRADPYLFKKDGKYYFTATCPAYDRVEIRCANSIGEIPSAPARVVWKKHPCGKMACHVWAPEIHYIMGKWVIYFAAGHKPGKWRIRPYALICKGNDPMKDDWEEGGMLQPADGDQYPFTDFSLDTTVFEHRGKWYIIWAQKFGTEEAEPAISNLYLAELETPTKLKTFHVLLSTPDYDWERRGGFWVNEGPAVLKHDGKIYVTYSASATGACYCMGMLRADENADLMDPRSWQKERYPVFKTDEKRKIYGRATRSTTITAMRTSCASVTAGTARPSSALPTASSITPPSQTNAKNTSTADPAPLHGELFDEKKPPYRHILTV